MSALLKAGVAINETVQHISTWGKKYIEQRLEGDKEKKGARMTSYNRS